MNDHIVAVDGVGSLPARQTAAMREEEEERGGNSTIAGTVWHSRQIIQ